MAAKYLTDGDRQRYGAYVSKVYQSVATSREPFPPLYHYTNGENLIQIIKSGSIWATQVGCLNDAKELLHAVDLFSDAIASRRSSPITNDFDALLGKITEYIKNVETDVVGAFVVCFSQSDDDLSQWRAYGGPNGGYALKFNVGTIAQYVASHNGHLLPVIYDQSSKNKLMADILSASEKFLVEGISANRAPSVNDWIEEFAPYWLENLAFLAPLFKDDAFKDEKEWRLIRYLKPSDVVNLEFSERSSMMRRHLPIRFMQPDEVGYTPLPLSGITVGPKTHQSLTRISVGDLLASRRYKNDQVPVTLSTVPFRTIS